MNFLEDKLFDYTQSHGLFDGVGRVLPAVSGGADSVAMVCALHRLRQGGHLRCDLVIGHVNHGLRGAASEADEAFVRELGQALGVPVVCRRVEVREFAATQRLSIETAGRLLRLGALAEMAKENDCGAVATAHHADDQAETLVHRLMRGTGLRGLCGIRPFAMHEGVRFVRPMLGLRRSEIVAYCRAGGVAWREDASNLSCAFTRNRIRHRLMPELGRQMADAAGTLTGLAHVCGAAQERIEAAAKYLLDPVASQQGTVAFDRVVFAHLSPWVQVELLGRAVLAVGGGLRDMTIRHYQAVMADAAATGNTKTMWPGNITAAVEGRNIVISKAANDLPIAEFQTEPVVLEVGKTTFLGPYRVQAAFLERPSALPEGFLHRKSAMTERLDADRIEGPLVMRRLEPGDRFWPIGLCGAKKAARFLMDSKIDKQSRKGVFVLADAQKILWLAPLRLDDRVKVTASTRRILEIMITFRT